LKRRMFSKYVTTSGEALLIMRDYEKMSTKDDRKKTGGRRLENVMKSFQNVV